MKDEKRRQYEGVSSNSFYVGVPAELRAQITEFCEKTNRDRQHTLRTILGLFFAEYADDGGVTAEQRLIRKIWDIVPPAKCAKAVAPQPTITEEKKEVVKS